MPSGRRGRDRSTCGGARSGHGTRPSTPSASVRRRMPARSRAGPGRRDAVAHLRERLVDERDQALAGTARFEGELRLADGDRAGVGEGEGVVDAADGGGLARERDERACACSRGGRRRCPARLLRRAERADEIVDELEGESEASRRRLRARAALRRRRRPRTRPRRSGARNEYTAVLLKAVSRIASARRMPRRDAVLDIGELAGRRDADRRRRAARAGARGSRRRCRPARRAGTPRAAAGRRRGSRRRRRAAPRRRHRRRRRVPRSRNSPADVRDAAAHRCRGR